MTQALYAHMNNKIKKKEFWVRGRPCCSRLLPLDASTSLSQRRTRNIPPKTEGKLAQPLLRPFLALCTCEWAEGKCPSLWPEAKVTGGPSLGLDSRVTQASASPEGSEPASLFPFLGRHKGMTWPNPRVQPFYSV
jgi:hypothetical protein